MEYKITVLPGDGIGPEVIDESVKVLEAVGRRFGHDFALVYGMVGGGAIDATGSALPDETIEMCLNSDAVLFGAVGGPKWDDPRSTVRPEQGLLALRKGLGLFANLRPVQIFPGLAIVKATADAAGSTDPDGIAVGQHREGPVHQVLVVQTVDLLVQQGHFVSLAARIFQAVGPGCEGVSDQTVLAG